MTDRQSQKKGPPGLGRGLSAQGARAYQWAVEAVVSIPIAGALGWWADSKLGTEPFGLLIGLLFGFVTFVLRLVRMRGLVEGAASETEAKETPEEQDPERETDPR